MSKDSKTCPMCGSTDIDTYSYNADDHGMCWETFHKCKKCGRTARDYCWGDLTKEELLTVENRQLKAEVEKLKAENERLKEKYITEKALRDAAKYLRRFQDWRTGKDIRTQEDAGIYPADLTDAIDTILFYLGLSEPLTNCDGCKYNGEYQNFEGCIMAGSFGDQSCKFEPKDNEVEK